VSKEQGIFSDTLLFLLDFSNNQIFREILESIDRQVAEAQNIHRLAEIQQNLDTSALEKVNDNSLAEYKERFFE
jgi:hypothetical protein